MARRQRTIGITIAAVADQPDLLFHPGIGATLRLRDQQRRRRHQRRLRKRCAGARLQLTLLELRAGAMSGAAPGRRRTIAEEPLARERLMHHAITGPAAMIETNQRAPHRQARDEALRAVDWIEDPDIFRIGANRAELLADDAMMRKG